MVLLALILWRLGTKDEEGDDQHQVDLQEPAEIVVIEVDDSEV